MFKAIGDALNKVTTYFFINAKAKARGKSRDYHKGNCEQVSKAKAIYEIQIKRYFLGIGFFASFIEGTDAYKAREELYNALMDVKMPVGGNDSITSINKFGVLEFFLAIINNIRRSMGNPFLRMNLREAIFADGTTDFTHPLNVFRYLGFLLVFFKRILPHKLIFQAPVMVFIIPVFILAFFTELVLMLADTILLDPIRFVCEEIKQHYDYRDKEYLYLPAEEYKGTAKIFDAFEAEKRKGYEEVCEKKMQRGFLLEKEKKIYQEYSGEDSMFTQHISNEKALAILSPEQKGKAEVMRNSLFFKMYNNERLANYGLVNPRYKTDLQGLLIKMDRSDRQNPLSKEDNNAIVTIYRALESMWHFYWHNPMPKELNQQIVKTWLESASQFEEAPNSGPKF